MEAGVPPLEPPTPPPIPEVEVVRQRNQFCIPHTAVPALLTFFRGYHTFKEKLNSWTQAMNAVLARFRLPPLNPPMPPEIPILKTAHFADNKVCYDASDAKELGDFTARDQAFRDEFAAWVEAMNRKFATSDRPKLPPGSTTK